METNKQTFTNAFLAEIANAGSYRFHEASTIEKYKHLLNATQIKKTIKELIESGDLVKVKRTQFTNGKYSTYVDLKIK